MSSRVTFEDGRFGLRAVVRGPWDARITAELLERHAAELELNQGKGWRGTHVEFLVELTHLRAFEILDLNICDISPIHCLHNLKRLGITTYCRTEINFAAFPFLESCGIEWRPKVRGLFDCSTLRELFINRFRGRNVNEFSRLTSLESLAILNAPIETLHGLQGLTKLRSLRIALLRRLTSLAGIETLVDLETLDIHTCRGITAIDEVGQLHHLKQLFLNNCGPIESLRPLDRIKHLEAAVFYESTNIVDGDLSPLMRQKSLQNVSFQNRRHYSHRREDFGRAYSG